MDARVTCCKLAIVVAEYAYVSGRDQEINELQPRPEKIAETYAPIVPSVAVWRARCRSNSI